VVLGFNDDGTTCSVLLLGRRDGTADVSTRVFFAGEKAPVTDEEGHE
jgi:hypothetical protein